MGKHNNNSNQAIEALKKEKCSPIKLKVIENWMFAAAIILAILTVYILGKLNWDSLNDNWIIKGGLWTGIVIALSFIWYIAFHFIIRDVKEKKHARIIYNEIINAIKIITGFEKNGKEIITFLQSIEKDIVSPQKYISLLDETRNSNAHETSIQNIQLMGSMTGFFCLLPLSLRNHICAINENATIDIIGSIIKLDDSVTYYNLAIYPVAFVAKTMVALIDLCNNFKNKNQQVTFNIYHFPYDITEALYILGDNKLISTQSLGPNNINLIFRNSQTGILLEKVSSNDKRDQFERYRHSFNNIKKDLYNKNKYETWTLLADSNNLKLNIKGNRYWKIIDNSIEFNGNPSLTNPEIFIEGTSEVENFLHDFYDSKDGMYKNSNNNSLLKKYCSKIKEIDDELKNNEDLSHIECSCGWNNY